MFSTMHKRLVRNGAPQLPPGYKYRPIVVFINDVRYLRMTIRRKDGIWNTEVARWTVDPETYFNGDNTMDKVIRLCENAIYQCDDFEVEEL